MHVEWLYSRNAEFRVSDYGDRQPLSLHRLGHTNVSANAASEYRVPYTFVESLNEGTLFDRSARTFEEAARTQRLYDVVVGEDQRIIGAGMLQDTFKEADGVTGKRSWALSWCILLPAASGSLAL